jgi:hypothetical protein
MIGGERTKDGADDAAGPQGEAEFVGVAFAAAALREMDMVGRKQHARRSQARRWRGDEIHVQRLAMALA